METERRQFLVAAAALGVGTLALSPGQGRGDDKAKEDKKGQPEEEVSAPEDLMREHGVARICTRDADFSRFPFLEMIDPVR